MLEGGGDDLSKAVVRQDISFHRWSYVTHLILNFGLDLRYCTESLMKRTHMSFATHTCVCHVMHIKYFLHSVCSHKFTTFAFKDNYLLHCTDMLFIYQIYRTCVALQKKKSAQEIRQNIWIISSLWRWEIIWFQILAFKWYKCWLASQCKCLRHRIAEVGKVYPSSWKVIKKNMLFFPPSLPAVVTRHDVWSMWALPVPLFLILV